MDGPQVAGLEHKVVLVTGSSRGLGAATALAMAEAGADVIVTYRRREDEANAIAAAIRAKGRRALVHHLDLEDQESIEALFATITEALGQLDVAVLNAAATSFRPLLQAEPKHLERTFAVSCVGFLRCVQLATPLLQQSGGTIIGVSGADTRTLIPAHGILAGAKAAMETMIRYLAEELGPIGVTIFGVNPGTILGDSIRLMLGDLYRYAEESEERSHPLRTGARPEDIALPITMLASPAGRWLHGSIVDLDGGSIFAMCGRWMKEVTEFLLLRDGDADPVRGPSVAG